MTLETNPICHLNPTGHDRLLADAELRDTVADFWERDQPELFLGGLELGAGARSITHALGGVAVKISSPTSSREYEQYATPTMPEDLTLQFFVLNGLAGYLAEHPSHGIQVPAQYFALRSVHGAYMSGQEYMEGWQTLDSWLHPATAPYDEQAASVVTNGIQNRLLRAIPPSATAEVHGELLELRAWLHDLTDWSGATAMLRTDNILVPEQIAAGADVPVCIIDQPSVGTRSIS